MTHLDVGLFTAEMYVNEPEEKLIELDRMLGGIACCDCSLHIDDHQLTPDGDYTCDDSAHIFMHFRAVRAALQARRETDQPLQFLQAS